MGKLTHTRSFKIKIIILILSGFGCAIIGCLRGAKRADSSFAPIVSAPLQLFRFRSGNSEPQWDSSTRAALLFIPDFPHHILLELDQYFGWCQWTRIGTGRGNKYLGSLSTRISLDTENS